LVKENEEKRERNDDGVSTEREERKRRSRMKEAGIRYTKEQVRSTGRGE